MLLGLSIFILTCCLIEDLGLIGHASFIINSIFKLQHSNRKGNLASMGGQCSSSRHTKEEYELISELQHPTFGHIARLRPLSKFSQAFPHAEQIAAKLFTFDDRIKQQEYTEVLRNARSYQNIPTLITIFSWQVDGGSVQGQAEEQQEPKTPGWARSKTPVFGGTCINTLKVKIFFQYHEFSLEEVLSKKKQSIVALKRRDFQIHHANHEGNPYFLLPKDLKLNDYQAIDGLPHATRKIVNLYYQEVQVLRMIDHIIGALYFLNHVQHSHQAVAPNNIMVDEEGKFILIDALVFRLQSNYEVGLTEYTQLAKNKAYRKKVGDEGKQSSQKVQQKLKVMKYLSPQLLAHVKASHRYHQEDTAKAEIFSVGVMALEMCLLDAFEDAHTLEASWGNLRMNRTELTKQLLVVRTRYSAQLVELLREMLEYEPVKRISYGVLIDKLNPLLSGNMEKIQKLYSGEPEHEQSRISAMSLSGRGQDDTYSNQLMRKLSDLESRFQKILKGRVLYEHRGKLDENRVKEDEKKILKQLSRLGGGKAREDPNALPQGQRREVRGSELYEIYLHEYQSIKKNRVK